MSNAVAKGVAYLVERQESDGHWEDFNLPVGSSDSWITAYVGAASALAGRQTSDAPVWRAACRAANWLLTQRPYERGWGYNATTGPDADSTAFALRLLRATGHEPDARDQAWLAERWQPCGGCATYDAQDGWGQPHPDVTAVAFFALCDADRIRLTPRVRGYSRRTQDPDGSWPAYWWRTRHYSTFHNLLLSAALKLPIRTLSWNLTVDPDRMVRSAFDLAFVIGTVALTRGLTCPIDLLVDELLALQDRCGYWPGAGNLRVTRHDAPDPVRRPVGDLFVDTNHLLTTASAVYVLSLLQLWGCDESLDRSAALSRNVCEVPLSVPVDYGAVAKCG